VPDLSAGCCTGDAHFRLSVVFASKLMKGTFLLLVLFGLIWCSLVLFGPKIIFMFFGAPSVPRDRLVRFFRLTETSDFQTFQPL
jgi:hypothetical protein